MRSTGVCAALLVLSGLTLAAAVHADSTALRARLECPAANTPGRIVCELRVDAAVDTLVWADALVVRAPPFARPLRSRVVAKVGGAGGAGAARAKLALVGSSVGVGELQLNVRGVLCRESASGQYCRAEVVPIASIVEVREASAPAP